MLRGLNRLEPLAMGEQDDAARVRGHAEIADQTERRHRNLAPDGGRNPARVSTILRPTLAQQPDRLCIGELVEIAVERADAIETPDGMQAHDQIGMPAHLCDRRLQRRGNGEHGPRRPLAFERDQRGLRRGARRQTVIDDNGRTPRRVQPRTVAEIADTAAFELVQFTFAGPFEKAILRAGCAPHLFIDDGVRRIAFDDGAERHFRRARRTDLAHQHKVERGMQGARDLHPHRHAAARQGVNDGAIK